MKVYRDLSEYSPSRKAIVTVGTFDGVHIGHQKLLATICDLARDHDAHSVLLTFFPHPRLVLFPDDNDLKLLTALDERIEQLGKLGIDHLIVHPFSTEFSRIPAWDYVRDILVGRLNVEKLVIGYDHHFGRNREGNLSYLKKVAPDFRFDVVEIPAQEIDEVNVSSTKIRRALLAGEIDVANKYLGYKFALTGTVVKGNSIGAKIGFPTANIRPADPTKLIPGNGVYVVSATVAGAEYRGVANIGTRPTVEDHGKTWVEVHIFDFSDDIYGREISIEFEAWLRPEEKYNSIDELTIQIERDVVAARNFFGTGSH